MKKKTLVKKKFVYVDYIGCEKRKLDSQRIINYFLINKYELTENLKISDIIVIITCAFNKEFEDLSIKKINQLYNSRKSNSKIIISGCLPSINRKKFEEYKDLILIPILDINRFDEITHFKIKLNEIKDPNTTIFDKRKYCDKDINIYYTNARKLYEEAKRGFKIRICYGCLGNCSYCVTQLATGKLKSKSLEKIKEEFILGLKMNYSTFFLTGGDTGAYGIDRESSVCELFSELLKIQGNYKFFLHDFGIHWLIKYRDQIIPIIKEHEEKFEIINFPIQSVSNKVLKLMRRPYLIQNAIKSLKELKHEIPNLTLGTHIIIGFPGENENDFQDTLEFVETNYFDFIIFYKYSDHTLADSYNLPNKNSKEIIDTRYNRILEKYINLAQ